MSFPTLHVSDALQSIIFGDDASEVVPPTATFEVDVTTTSSKERDPTREVDVLPVPRSKRRMNDRRREKQSHVNMQPQWLAVISLPSVDIPSLPRVVNWARRTPALRHVAEMIDMYPVIMSDDYMKGRVATCTRELVRLQDYEYKSNLRSH